MPVNRIQPLPFPDPPHLTALIERDPSLIEPGFRPAAREVPLPREAGFAGADILGTDAEGGAVAVIVTRKVTGGAIESALALRDWLERSLSTLRALCPSLGGTARAARCVLLTGSIEPAAAALLALSQGTRLMVLEVGLFETASGEAIWVRPSNAPSAAAEAAPAPQPDDPRARDGAASQVSATDPLAGIPLTAEEAAEFRRLAERASRKPELESPARPMQDWRRLSVEN